MQQQSSTETLGLSNSSYSENETEKKEREIVFIEGTPYNLTRMTTKERWRIAIGNSLVSKKTFKKQWMARIYIKSKPIELLINTTIAITGYNHKNRIKE